jgi:hypothetical protein
MIFFNLVHFTWLVGNECLIKKWNLSNESLSMQWRRYYSVVPLSVKRKILYRIPICWQLLNSAISSTQIFNGSKRNLQFPCCLFAAKPGFVVANRSSQSEYLESMVGMKLAFFCKHSYYVYCFTLGCGAFCHCTFIVMCATVADYFTLNHDSTASIKQVFTKASLVILDNIS